MRSPVCRGESSIAKHKHEYGGEAVEAEWRRKVRRAPLRLFVDGSALYAHADEPVALADLEAAHRIGEELADRDLSIVDRSSFAVIERLGLARVASFDDGFAIYRFGSRRERAFEVVR